ncbi:MAG: sigma 54-interacting transcriptional regulator [Planctomycetes bacterium]|nr:sigma 54-interacting transcriptional regulator [Planctomycetota bacterium]
MARFADFLARLRGEGRDPERARLLAILGLNRQLAKAEGKKQLLTMLVDEAVQLFGAERGFLLVARDADGCAVEVARSLDREPIAHPERKLSSTVWRQALVAGQPVFSEDAQEGPLGGAQSIADLKLRSVLCVPLRVGDRVLGGLYLDHRFQARAFAETDLPWLQAFADQAAIVVHLHELLAQNRAWQEQLAAQNERLQRTVAAQAHELVALQPQPRQQLRHDFTAIRGESPALLRALHLLDRIVDAEFPVLLTGESGTGKEVVARALHAQGPRRHGPFVAINVAAIQPGLLESELFGHVRGAFTGADRDRPGLLQQAAGGVLFLDEVTEMDLEVQAKLLRVLEDKRVRAVGSDRERPVDVRIVAATNREPMAVVDAGRFRRDLYFRLAVVTVPLPPLRERGADVVLLAEHFLADQAQQRGQAPPLVSADLAAALRARPWPGNLRQLRNEMLRLQALAGDGPLRPDLLSNDATVAGTAQPATFDLATLEQWAIERALVAAGGNKAEAARLLGIARRTLYARLGERTDDERGSAPRA